MTIFVSDYHKLIMAETEYISAKDYAEMIGLSKTRVCLLIKNKRKDRIPHKIKYIDKRPFMLVNIEERRKALEKRKSTITKDKPKK